VSAGLLRSELRRATSRRLVRVLAGCSALAAVIVGAVAFAVTSSSDPYDSHRAGDLLKGTSGILALLAWAVGASLIGAEHQSRGLTTTLTFVPSRLRVFAAKAASALAVAVGWAAATLTAIAVALLPTLLAHGAQHPGDPTVGNIAAVVLRGAAVAGFAAALGFAIASLGRSTAAALGVGFAYILVLENLLGSTLRGVRPWMLLGNTIVWVSGHAQAEVPGRTVATAGALLAAVAAALLAGSAVAFRARDVA
jgi:ABC-type transport system involved in multi-copper enzyme maturation permease subunit